MNQKVMKHQLRKAGCKTVDVCENGQEALDFLQNTIFHSPSQFEANDQKPLSIVLLDVEMPVMDGLTCIRRIRELEQTGAIVRHVPVIAITANARPEQIQFAIEAGMDEVAVSFICVLHRDVKITVPNLVTQTKPLTMSNLVGRIEALVTKWQELETG